MSNAGLVIKSLKLAKGDIAVWLLLLGVKYGSPGVTTTALANNVAGGNAKVDHTPAFARAVASVPRSVVIALGISPPKMLVLNKVG